MANMEITLMALFCMFAAGTGARIIGESTGRQLLLEMGGSLALLAVLLAMMLFLTIFPGP